MSVQASFCEISQSERKLVQTFMEIKKHGILYFEYKKNSI